MQIDSKTLINDCFGGLAAMLVALPSAIAFGIIVYAAIGPGFTGRGAITGILGTVAVGLVAALFGGTKRLISAPCAPAAAILAVYVRETLGRGTAAAHIPLLLILVGLLAGAFQVTAGLLRGGRFIKYIPYPVVTGYLSGVGALIFTAQLPRLLGLPKEITFLESFTLFDRWVWQSLLIGGVAIVVMTVAPRVIKKIPATILALLFGIAAYFGLALFDRSLLTLEDNPFVIGPIVSGDFSVATMIASQWHGLNDFSWPMLKQLLVPAATLAALLSIDTLKTCLVLNALTRSRSDSNRELMAQGLGNIASALCCGMPGAGTMGATLVNVSSGGMTRFSGFLEGLFALLVLLALGQFIAWIPIAALAGILIVIAVRMVDRKMFSLLKRKSTIVDLIVILGVVIAALTLSLIWAAVVGIVLSVLLFLRDQIMRPVVRRRFKGNEKFSKKKRVPSAMEVLARQGERTVIFELQGQLFFGTTDQLMLEIEPVLPRAKTVILDMRRVHALDYSAACVLHQIEARISESGGRLVFAAVPQNESGEGNIRQYLEGLGFVPGRDGVSFFESLDDALESAEDELLRESWTGERTPDRVLDLAELPFFERVSADTLSELRTILKTVEYPAGSVIFKEGGVSSQLYFVARGTVKIMLPVAGSSPHLIAAFGQGDFFGDLSFLDRAARSADATASEPVTLYSLSRDDFDELAKAHPRTASLVFEQLSRMLAARLRQTNIELEALSQA